MEEIKINEQKRKQQGITLIALVVTIVVLLILAAVSIGMLTGENGIITQAQKSREETIIADEKEILSLSYTACKQDNMINDMFEEIVTDEQLQKELDNNKRNTTVTQDGDDLEVIFNDTNHKYIIYQDGTIEQVDNLSPEEANRIIDIVSYYKRIFVLTADGKVREANIIEGNIFHTLEIKENAETITKDGIREKGNGYFIDNKGKVYTWGDSDFGQLGYNGMYEDSEVPICISDMPGNVLNGKNIIKICSYGSIMVALDDQGKVYAWGHNDYGQLGNGQGGKYTDYSNKPICISDITTNILNTKKIKEIYSDQETTIVIDNEGRVYTWGKNDYGQLGNETNEEYNTQPMCISDIPGSALNEKNIIEVYMNQATIIAIDSQGKVYTWGRNAYGQLGNGTLVEYSNKPICISDLPDNALKGKNIKFINAKSYPTIALDDEGKVYRWEENGIVKCLSDTIGNELYGKTIINIATGLALDNQGNAYDCYTEECDNINNLSGSELNGKFITNIYYGEGFLVAIDKEKKVYAWGKNDYGQLGDGNYKDSEVPICISDINNSELKEKKVTKMSDLLICENYYAYYYALEDGSVYANIWQIRW